MTTGHLALLVGEPACAERAQDWPGSALVNSAEAEQDAQHAAHAKAIKYVHKIPAKTRAPKTVMLDRRVPTIEV